MGLFDMTDGTLVPVSSTSFAAEGVFERRHLQGAIRDNISLLGDDLLVIAEEFGSFTDGHRRIDLLCIDRDARPVVVELKRTNDGGHMELQALRYAAMVSAMTFDDLVSIFEKHLDGYEAEGSGDARISSPSGSMMSEVKMQSCDGMSGSFSPTRSGSASPASTMSCRLRARATRVSDAR